jgi:hypothetical protein
MLTLLRDGTITLEDVVAYRVRRVDKRTVLEEIEIDDETFDVYERWEHGLTNKV